MFKRRHLKLDSLQTSVYLPNCGLLLREKAWDGQTFLGTDYRPVYPNLCTVHLGPTPTQEMMSQLKLYRRNTTT